MRSCGLGSQGVRVRKFLAERSREILVYTLQGKVLEAGLLAKRQERVGRMNCALGWRLLAHWPNLHGLLGADSRDPQVRSKGPWRTVGESRDQQRGRLAVVLVISLTHSLSLDLPVCIFLHKVAPTSLCKRVLT